MTFIYGIPAWLFISACVLGSCIIAGSLLTLTRNRISRNDLIAHNDVAGPILTIIGTVLAVMMSFMVIGVWQEYDNAAQNVQVEAGALSDIHHLADGLNEPDRHLLQARVDKYISIVLNVEWPLMQHGGESQVAHDTGYEIYKQIVHLRPATPAQQTLQSTALDMAMKFLDARRQRIHDNRQGIPFVLWAVMLFIGAVTVLFCFYFRVDRPKAQLLMVLAVTAVIAITFSLIAELDFPFRGDVAISTSSFEHVFKTVHNIGLEH